MKNKSDEQVFQYACGDLEAVFNADPSKPIRSPFEAFDGRKRKRKPGEKPLKQCSTKETLQVTASETRRGKITSEAPIRETYTGKKVALLGRLHPDHIVMIRACFMLESHEQHEYQRKASVIVQRRYYEQIGSPRLSSTREVLAKMALLKLESMRAPALAIGIQSRTYEYLGINQKNWHENYAEKWRAIRDIVEKLHREAVMAFDKLVR